MRRVRWCKLVKVLGVLVCRDVARMLCTWILYVRGSGGRTTGRKEIVLRLQ